jgi:phosphoenolpyruvate carboxykinase (GTP)
MITHDAIFTNVAVTEDNQPWWEGRKDGEPAIDWQGRAYDPKRGPAAHPNSRFTVSARQNPSWAPESEDPRGVPISAIIFGGRRRDVAPLVMQAKSWAHGVLMGAGVASETTAAATGATGVVRRDPMAMKPFCGYNFADYWAHWLRFEERSNSLPQIFHVNWFRQDDEGNFIWPGFGENLRVLRWILDRAGDGADAVETPVGYLPTPESLDVADLELGQETLDALLDIDSGQWLAEMQAIEEYLHSYGERLPEGLKREHRAVVEALAEKRRAAASG